MSKASWEKVIALLSYSPTAFGIFFLMTSRETGDSYEDKSGVSGVMAGLMCVAYGLCAGAASSGCPADICKVLVLARLGLGVVALLAGIFILALGDETEKAIKFVLMYLFLALMTVPEAGSFYLYVRQVQLEKFMAENANPQGSYPMSNQQMPMQQSYVRQWPPSLPGNVPQFSAWQLCKPSSKQCLWQRMLASKLIGQGLQLKVLGHSSHLCLLEPGRQLVQLPFLLLARGFRDKGTAFAARGRQMSSS